MPRYRLKIPFLLATLLCSQNLYAGDESQFVTDIVNQYQDSAVSLSDKMWSWAEPGFQEHKSASAMMKMLSDAGFTVNTGVADIPTAFSAHYGSSGPVIGILAEMDALPGMKQESLAVKTVSDDKQYGHACGHNLFAAGSVTAAIAIKEWLEKTGHDGQIRLFGTPAEEGGSGKVFMVREGVFDGTDIMLHWHPGAMNEAETAQSLAYKSAKFRFHGIASHAAAAPDKGRSALDAVEAMDYMVNMMREHIPEKARIHYVITNGGAAPNVVPEFAEVYYYVRAPDADTVNALWARIEKIADAAALGTETRMDHEVIGGTWNTLTNLTVSEQVHKSLSTFGGLSYSPEEQAFAGEMKNSLGQHGIDRLGAEKVIAPFSRNITTYSASTDVGDVSWNIPTAGLSTATWVPGTYPHSWQAVAASGMSIGHKGMILAAKTMALTGINLLEAPEIISSAKEELKERRHGITYTPMIGDRQPALDYRK